MPATAGRPPGTTPQPGDVVHVGARASVQFSAQSAITLRVIHVHQRPTYHGWCWLDGYQLDANGDAVERREIFVQTAGLVRVGPSPRRTPTNGWPSAAQTVDGSRRTRAAAGEHNLRQR
jgi:hypothetical protein